MEEKQLSIRSKDPRLVNTPIAEFRLHGESADRAAMARRTSLISVITQLPQRRQAELENAFSAAADLVLGSGGEATVVFSLTERKGQPFVDISIRPSLDIVHDDLTQQNPESRDRSLDWDRLREIGASLDHFEWTPHDDGLVLQLGQGLLNSFIAPTQSEVMRWGRMLETGSVEAALLIAMQHGRATALKLGQAEDREKLREDFGDASSAENLAMMSLVASKSRSLIVFLDEEANVSWVNEAFIRATGYSLAEIDKLPFIDVLFGVDADATVIRRIQQAFASQIDVKIDALCRTCYGKSIWVELDILPIFNVQGQLSRWLVNGVDVTKRHETEEALREAKERAEETGRSKSEFLANMSHEIRTPMNAIIGMTELALATQLTREQKEYLLTVQVSAESLLQLLNDILDLSKIEAGKFTIDETDFDLAATIRDTLRALAVKAHEKGLELAVHMPMDIPQHLSGDAGRLKQIFFNLVGNAVKFTQKGEVVIEVESQWSTEDTVCLHFKVRDTGVGIPKEKLSKIFDAFTQADATTTRNFGGTGLGLTITSELVHLMNGKIWVESQVGVGSTFHFTLEFKRATSPPPRSIDLNPSLLAGKKVLVVDDNSTNRRILDDLLHHWGMTPTVVDGGEAALAELEDASQRGEIFDLVLLDAVMPGMDGFQLADRIRQRNDLKFGKVMMLSSIDRPGSAERCRVLGVDHFFAKPVSASALLNEILAAIGMSTHRVQNVQNLNITTASSMRAHSPSRPLRILVVDDHEANRSLASTVLSKRGHICDEASDGVDALKKLKNQNYDIVLMDVQMPNMDGFQATAKIRQEERAIGRHIPIIALTAHAMQGDRETCLSAGMDTYLCKPIRPGELIKLVESIGSDGLGTAAKASERRFEVDETVATEFDYDAALESMDYDKELLRQQMEFFVDDGPELMTILRQAASDGDTKALENSAHRLKGLLSRYSVNRAVGLAQQIEHLAKDGRLENINEFIEELTPLVERVVAAARTHLA